MPDLTGSVAVVTGGSSGIGRATALAFAEHGATVVVTARREHALADVVDECRRRGAEAMAVPADVTDAGAVDRVAQETAARFGRVDIWVNNAAVTLFSRLEDAPIDVWHRVIETNVFGTYHGIRAALPWMREQGKGVIVNVSSVVAKVPAPYVSSYVASKYAMRALSDCVRQELRDAPGISVCTVLPGSIDTPLFQNAANYTGRKPKPLKPVMSAERVADRIVECAAMPRRETVVGASGGMATAFRRLAPGLVERVAKRAVGRDHFTDEAAPAGPGNVFESSTDGHSISGGWTQAATLTGPDDPRAASRDGAQAPSRQRRAALAAAGAVGVAGAVGAGITGRLRRRNRDPMATRGHAAARRR